MLKVRQKISHCFRSIEGAHIFLPCAQLSVDLSTARKQNLAVYEALMQLVTGRVPMSVAEAKQT